MTTMAITDDNLSQQATLGLMLPEERSFERFFLGENAAVVTQLQHLLDDTVDRFVFIWGESAAGKTHLLKACCALASARHLKQALVPLSQANQLSAQMLQGLEDIDLVCLDDLQNIAGQPAWEEGLFHFYNRFQAGHTRLIISSHLPPNQLGIILPDLLSRLNAASIFQVKALNETDMRLALQELVMARGLKCSETVSQYILTHCGRDMRTLMQVTRVLDQASLAAKRPLTIPFVKRVLLLD